MSRAITIRGQRFQLRRLKKIVVDGVACDGKCDPLDCTPRVIAVKNDLDGERELDVFIHEMLHAALWDLDESAIEETATDIAHVLFTKLGYRRT